MQRKGIKVKKISKEEFSLRVQFIKNVASERCRSLVCERDSMDYKDDLQLIVDHDPKLAQMCIEADFALIEPLNKIVKYLSQKTEN